MLAIHSSPPPSHLQANFETGAGLFLETVTILHRMFLMFTFIALGCILLQYLRKWVIVYKPTVRGAHSAVCMKPSGYLDINKLKRFILDWCNKTSYGYKFVVNSPTNF